MTPEPDINEERVGELVGQIPEILDGLAGIDLPPSLIAQIDQLAASAAEIMELLDEDTPHDT
jgi:hypothetical protein